MFTYTELLDAYRRNTKVGTWKHTGVYVASVDDLGTSAINDNLYYIMLDAERRYLYHDGAYVGLVSVNGNIDFYNKPIVPEELEPHYAAEQDEMEPEKNEPQMEPGTFGKKELSVEQMELKVLEMELPDIDLNAMMEQVEQEVADLMNIQWDYEKEGSL